jgi:hypothetical protein
MSRYRIERRDLDGRGPTRVRAYDLPAKGDFWASVTDVPCPSCPGTVRWAEAGYVPGYRICDACGRHFLAAGTAAAPLLLRVGSRRSRQARIRVTL